MKIENLELQRLNKVLMGVFLLLLGWLLLDILLSLGKPGVMVLGPEERIETGVSDELKPLADFNQYSREIKKRQLFKGTLAQDRVTLPDSSVPDATRILPSDFHLVGIAAGVNPQAIVQNKKTNQTYFLYRGQSQDNLKAEDISGNKVILNYAGETFELFL